MASLDEFVEKGQLECLNEDKAQQLRKIGAQLQDEREGGLERRMCEISTLKMRGGGGGDRGSDRRGCRISAC